jgi:acetolactate synthase-1/2/3 large subunit
MNHTPRRRTGGQILIDQLVAQGVDRLTCVPGESYLAALDAMHDAPIDVMICRNEGGAAIMAEAYGKMTGRPGICFVTRGPGATNAAHGLHIAAQDSTPMILFAGQVGRDMLDREAFQEIDFGAVFGSIAKWVVEVKDAARLPEFVARAFRVAMQGRPGPVVVSLPEDMLTEMAEVGDAPRFEPAESWPSPAAMQQFDEMLAASKAPLAILGGSRWSEAACTSFVRFAERAGLPVTTSFRRSHLFPADHPNYVGDVGIGPNPALSARVKSADLILLLGGRLSEMPSSSYTLLALDSASPDQRRGGDTEELRASYIGWTEKAKPIPGAFQYGEAMVWLRERLPPDAMICNGAGNFAGWIHRYYRFRKFGTQLAPTSGSMGYGVPAAIMAKRQHPDRIVVCFAGDGCFLMNGQEFATAVQFGIPVIIIVIDNAMYGTIRMHQEANYPDRITATALKNPDFSAYAAAFGGHGERVERTEEFAPAFERALASGKPAILHCFLDPQAITPAKTLNEFRPKA